MITFSSLAQWTQWTQWTIKTQCRSTPSTPCLTAPGWRVVSIENSTETVNSMPYPTLRFPLDPLGPPYWAGLNTQGPAVVALLLPAAAAPGATPQPWRRRWWLRRSSPHPESRRARGSAGCRGRPQPHEQMWQSMMKSCEIICEIIQCVKSY